MKTSRLAFAATIAALLISLSPQAALPQVPPPPDGEESLSAVYTGRA